MEKLVIGLLAHGDAGKTTLSEGILYLAGAIRRLGRVDNRDAFLDTYELERARGITIFSKQAVFTLGKKSVTLLDTPGHVDFSAEMERTLQVLDYAVLVISGTDGVQGHTQTLWRLLKRYEIPTFLFINKMDQQGTDLDSLMGELKQRLDGNCVLFGNGQEGSPDFWENLAMCHEDALELYLEKGAFDQGDIRKLISERKVFPCYFGSALKLTGVEDLLKALEIYIQAPTPGASFGARVYKISRDEQGNRLTHMKITGGSLKVKDFLPGEQEEKVNQIRIYSGAKYELIQEAGPGDVCAVSGPVFTRPGQGLGSEGAPELPLLEPVLTYQVILPEGSDLRSMLQNLRQLEEEEPELHILWDGALGEIQAQVMGDVQIEVLKNLIKERYGTEVEFGTGKIVYKETITNSVEGVGHFEPLRHYAEVHLLLEPGEPGSGLQFEACCSEDALDKNWQRLVLTHLEEKHHRGVLTGSEITDMKLTLIAGRAHLKHTEGGDFRQATYRAVRQGLREAKSCLLEPYYTFRLEVPPEAVGRAMTDIERLHGTFNGPFQEGDISVLTGSAPVATMRDYQREVISYTRGMGRISLSLKGYEPCHNAEEVIARMAYDPEADLENPTGSVFCAHGAGYLVPWNQVKEYMHVESPLSQGQRRQETGMQETAGQAETEMANRENRSPSLPGGSWTDDKELEEIFNRTFGKPKERRTQDSGPRYVTAPSEKRPKAALALKEKKEEEEEYLLVDGYNIIFAWEELRELSKVTIDGARQRLMDILCNYQGYKKCTLIVVFDAYKVVGNTGQALDYHNIHVVYTKEAETADQYIEKLAHKMGRSHNVTVATSDGLEQLIIYGQGCRLMSARDLKEDVEWVGEQIRQEQERLHAPVPGASGKNYLLSHADKELNQYLEDVRLGRRKE